MFTYELGMTLEKMMEGIPAKGTLETTKIMEVEGEGVYEEYVYFTKKHMYFKGIAGERKGEKVPAFAFGAMCCPTVGGGCLYLTLEEIKEEYPGVYEILMTPEVA